MKLLLDQGLPRSAAALLHDMGLDTLHVADVGMSAAEDPDILRWASSEARTIVSIDSDFHSLLALSAAKTPSVIRIRIEGLKAPEAASLIIQIVSQFRSDLEQGAVVTVQPGRMRMRRLPLI
jgi:predicted nuclease of predicted toxin-antitoxin system